MNKLKIGWVLGLIFLHGCTADEFLYRVPKDQLTSESVFNTNESILTYCWQFYDVFPGYVAAVPDADWDGDLMDQANPNPTGESNWAYGRVVVPTSSDLYTEPFANIRTINILLDNLENADISETDKEHWRSIGYFFKAYNYFNLVAKYGDITWVEHTLTDADTEVLFGPRDPREEVADRILDMLHYAEEHIRGDGDGANTVNVHVVRALLSRFGLFEGTWRKYHGTPGSEVFLRASLDASTRLIESFPTLHSNYDEVFNSESLAGVDGILLYKSYATGQVTHNLSTQSRNSGGRHDLTRKAMDMYLLTDGQTRWASPLFDGDESPYAEFRNRDRRLYYTVQPPYRVVPGSNQSRSWEHTEDPADREYFELMEQISGPMHKQLPTSNWNGYVMREAPHYFDNNLGQPFIVSFTGYKFYKYYNQLSTGVQGGDVSDAPIFRMGEVLVNHAEASYELGEFDQGTADLTINKLRERGKVASLEVDNIPADPTRDEDINSELWEIRRERAIELMGEGFRFDDLRRWKKLAYLSQRKLGAWIVRTPANARIPILNNDTEGYVAYRGQPTDMPQHYYLYPIPSNQVVITNGEVEQNSGW